MEAYFATMYEDIRHERPPILLLSLTHLDILEKSKVTDVEIKIKKRYCSWKVTPSENIERITCCIIVRTILV